MDVTSAAEKHAVIPGRLAELFAQSLEPTALYQEILALSGELVNSTSRSLFLREHEDGPLHEVASSGKCVDLIKFVPFEMGCGISAWVAQEKRPIKIARLGRRSRESGTCFLAAPILVEDQLIGVMTFANEEQEAFSEEDVILAESICARLGASLERRLFRQQQTSYLHRITELSGELASVEAELAESKRELARRSNAFSLVNRLVGSLQVLQHVVEFLQQEYRGRDSCLTERLSALSEEINRAAVIVERVVLLSAREPLTAASDLIGEETAP